VSSVLITGGAGFVGSHVTEMFLARGYSVAVIDDLSTGKRENVDARATLHKLDIRSREVRRSWRVASGCDRSSRGANGCSQERRGSLCDASVNIIGTINLLEAVRARSEAWRPRFVFASTGGALYGDFVTPRMRSPSRRIRNLLMRSPR